MTNVSNFYAPNGLRPVKYLSGLPYTGAVTRYKKEASVILAPGDPVVVAGGAETSIPSGVPLITRAATSSGTITGVVVGIAANPINLYKIYMAAADTGYVYVADEPNLLFEAMEDSGGTSGGTDIAASDVQNGVDINVSNASTTTGLSQCMLKSSSTAANGGSGFQCRIFELAQKPNNAIGDFARWNVMIHDHTYKAEATLI